MKLVKWTPMMNSVNMFDDIDTIFTNVFRNTHNSFDNNMNPSMDIIEENDRFIIHGDFPGMKKEDIEVSVDNDVLRISGNRREKHITEDANVKHAEIGYGEFNRSFNLNDSINANAISALYENGVLELILPKVEAIKNQTRQIKIK